MQGALLCNVMSLCPSHKGFASAFRTTDTLKAKHTAAPALLYDVWINATLTVNTFMSSMQACLDLCMAHAVNVKANMWFRNEGEFQMFFCDSLFIKHFQFITIYNKT